MLERRGTATLSGSVGKVIRIGTRVIMVDRYAQRRACTCKTPDPSWFDGLTGVVTATTSRGGVMVHLRDERLPMVFDARDFDVIEDEQHMTAGGE